MAVPSPTREIATYVQEEHGLYDVIVVYNENGQRIAVIPIGQIANRGSDDPLKYSYARAMELARTQWEQHLQSLEEGGFKGSNLEQFGPADMLSDEEWAYYLQTTGQGVSDITGEGLNRYNAPLWMIEDAWDLFNPDISLAEAIAQRYPEHGGYVPPWFEDKWGISIPRVRGMGRTVAPEVPTFAGPPTPGFLPELTGLEMGQPLEARPTKFASGQLLSRLTPSQLQGIGGYVNWAAGQVSGAPASFEDWYAGSLALLPRTIPRGAVRWSPSPYSV